MLNLGQRLCHMWVGIAVFVSISAYSAVTLDRTRIIFPGTEKSINVTISNDNPEEAYLAQSWIEDLQGNKLTKGAILATPPLQRIEPMSNSLVRLSTTPALSQLPQDRESVFYFNLREVPLNPPMAIPYKLPCNHGSNCFIDRPVFCLNRTLSGRIKSH